MIEKRVRSLAKGFSWRIIATATTFVLAVIVFHEDKNVMVKASAVAAAEFVVKLLIYYVHERVWLEIKWGVTTQK